MNFLFYNLIAYFEDLHILIRIKTELLPMSMSR